MPSLLTLTVPVRTSPASSTQLTESDLTDLEGGARLEATAAGHWLFGSDNTDMASALDATDVMTAVNNNPSHNTGYLQTDTAGLHGLLSPIDEQQDQTVCIVGSYPTGIQVIYGTSSTLYSEGSFYYKDGTNFNAASTGFEGSANSLTSKVDNTFVFFAVSTSTTRNERIVFLKGGNIGSGSGYTEYTTGTQTLVSPANKIGVGATYYNNAAFDDGGEKFAELIVHNDALPLSALQAISNVRNYAWLLVVLH